jgi:hypothetical protein
MPNVFYEAALGSAGLIVAPTPPVATPKVVGDGTAIQTQLDRINAGISSEVDIEGGVYIINTPLLLPDGVGLSGIAYTVAGKGQYATVLRAGPGLVGPLLQKRTPGVNFYATSFKDFALDAGTVAGCTNCFDLDGLQAAHLTGVAAYNPTVHGFAAILAPNTATAVTFTDCLVSYAPGSNGGDAYHGRSGGWNLIGCQAGGGQYSCYIEGGEGGITACRFDNAVAGNLLLAGSYAYHVDTCNMATSGDFNIKLDGAVKCSVMGCTVQDFAPRPGTAKGIWVAGDDNKLIGNTILYKNATIAGQCGFFIEGTTGNKFIGNTIATEAPASAGDIRAFLWNLPSTGNTYVANDYRTATLFMNPLDPPGIFALNTPAFQYNPVALATIPLTGSPLTYTNTNNYAEMVYGSGTATSAVSIIRNSVTTAVGTATPWAVRLEPGDAVLIAYTGTPVFVRQAIR